MHQLRLSDFWPITVTCDLISFIAKHPTKVVPVLRFVVRNIPAGIQSLRPKIRFDEERFALKQELLHCASIFEKTQGHYDLRNLHALQENLPPATSRFLSIYLLLRAMEPQIVVETGVALGISTSYTLQALSDNGQGVLYSIDKAHPLYMDENGLLRYDYTPAKRQGYFIPEELRPRWKLIEGLSSEKLRPLLKDLGEIDFFLHDSEHTYVNMTYEYNCAWPHIRTGGFLASDDIEKNTSFYDFARSHQVQPVVVGGVLGLVRKT